MKHYVCDKCGNYWRSYRAVHCPACMTKSVWEFDREQPAREHAAHVKTNYEHLIPSGRDDV